MFYKEAEEPAFIPQISRPDYGNGFFYCPSCGTGYYKADRCPNRGIATRKKSRERVMTETSQELDKTATNINY